MLTGMQKYPAEMYGKSRSTLHTQTWLLTWCYPMSILMVFCAVLWSNKSFCQWQTFCLSHCGNSCTRVLHCCTDMLIYISCSNPLPLREIHFSFLGVSGCASFFSHWKKISQWFTCILLKKMPVSSVCCSPGQGGASCLNFSEAAEFPGPQPHFFRKDSLTCQVREAASVHCWIWIKAFSIHPCSMTLEC